MAILREVSTLGRTKKGNATYQQLMEQYLDESNSQLILPQEPFETEPQQKSKSSHALEEPHFHADHRQRLRQKFLRDRSFDNFSDHEILELLLFYVYSRKDTNGIAHALLDEFATLKNVLEATPESLKRVHGIGDQAATLISMVVPLTRMYERCLMKNPMRIGNSRDAEKYCLSLMEGMRNEHFYVICLNAQCHLVGKRCISEGSLSEVAAYPRLVVETALNHNAHSVLLSHNHPGGTCAPSAEDIASTQQLQRLLNGLSILVLDHIIVANHQTYSMIQHGDIDYRVRGR